MSACTASLSRSWAFQWNLGVSAPFFRAWSGIAGAADLSWDWNSGNKSQRKSYPVSAYVLLDLPLLQSQLLGGLQDRVLCRTGSPAVRPQRSWIR